MSFTELLGSTGLARPTLSERLEDLEDNEWVEKEGTKKSRGVYSLTSYGVERTLSICSPHVIEGDVHDPVFRTLHAEIVALTGRVTNYGLGKRYQPEDPLNQVWIGAFQAGNRRTISVRFMQKGELPLGILETTKESRKVRRRPAP